MLILLVIHYSKVDSSVQLYENTLLYRTCATLPYVPYAGWFSMWNLPLSQIFINILYWNNFNFHRMRL